MLRVEGPRAFGAVLTGQIVSGVGSAMTCFGAAFWALAEAGDATAYSLLLAMTILPVAVGTALAGPLVDRWDRRWLMIVTNAVSAVATLAVAILFFSDALAMWHLYVLVIVIGLASGFIMPALEASVPLLVPKERLDRASGMVQLNLALRLIAAPALAGMVLAGAGLGAILVIDFATFGFSFLGLAVSVMPRPKPSARREQQRGFLAEYATAWQYMWQRPPLVYLLGLVFAIMLLMAGLAIALLTPLVLSFADERAAGFMVTVFGVGALGGGVLLGLWGGPPRRMDGVHGAFLLGGAGLVVLGLAESLTVIAIGSLLIGASSTSATAWVRVVWQLKVPADLLGRVFAMRIAIAAVAQCTGMLVALPLAEHIFEPLLRPDGALGATLAGTVLGTGDAGGIALTLVASGLCVLVGGAICAVSPATRLLEDRLPDVQT